MIATERETEGEAGSMHREPDVGFDLGSPGSRPGPKTGATQGSLLFLLICGWLLYLSCRIAVIKISRLLNRSGANRYTYLVLDLRKLSTFHT